MEHGQERIQAIPIERIDINPAFEIRCNWAPEGDSDLPGLAESLSGVEGQIYPIIVAALPEATSFGRMYTLIAGRRRLEAARLQKRTTIEARVLPPVRLDDPVTRFRLFAIAVAENVHRKNLTPEERREALRRLKQHYEEVYPPQRKPPSLQATPSSSPAYPSFTAWAAQQFNISRRAVSKDLRLAQLAHSAQVVPPHDAVTRPHPAHTPYHRREAQLPQAQPAARDDYDLVTQVQHTTAALQALRSLLAQEPRPQLPATECQHLQHVLEDTLAFLRHPDSMETLSVPMANASA